MKNKDNYIFYYCNISIMLSVSIFIFIFSVLFIGVEETKIQVLAKLLIGVGFWGSLITQFLLVYLTTKERKRMQLIGYKAKSINVSKIGLISFFKTKESKIVDVVLIVSLLSLVCVVALQTDNDLIIIFSLSIFSLMFNLHCILNGKNYRYIKLLKKFKKGRHTNEHTQIKIEK